MWSLDEFVNWKNLSNNSPLELCPTLASFHHWQSYDGHWNYCLLLLLNWKFTLPIPCNIIISNKMTNKDFFECQPGDWLCILFQLSAVFFLIFGLIFATSITGYVYRDTLKHQLHRSLNESIQEYGNGSIIDKDWDRIQTNASIHCASIGAYLL